MPYTFVCTCYCCGSSYKFFVCLQHVLSSIQMKIESPKAHKSLSFVFLLLIGFTSNESELHVYQIIFHELQ
jgi:hypothetical protein